MFAQHLAPFIKTPLFVLQAQYDSWQVPNILGSKTPALVNEFGANLTALVRSTILNRQGNAAFVDGCYHHTQGWDRWVVDGVTEAHAFSMWYANGTSVLPNNGAVISEGVYPCTRCQCNYAVTQADTEEHWVRV